MRSDVALSEEGSDVRHKELHRRSYRKETCRVNKICQETVMKTKRRGPWFPVEIATAGRKHLKDHEGRIRRPWQVVSVYGTVGGEEESPLQRISSWRVASLWPTMFSAVHTITLPLSSGERSDRKRVVSVSEGSI